MKLYKYNGQMYSVKQLSKLPECQVSYNALKNRLDKSISIEEALTTPAYEISANNYPIYEYKGKKYNLKQLSELPECHCSVAALRVRLQKDPDIEKAFKQPDRKSIKRYEYKGKVYTIRQLSELPECKISYSTLRKRLQEIDLYEGNMELILTDTVSRSRVFKYKDKRLTILQLLELPECNMSYIELRDNLINKHLDAYSVINKKYRKDKVARIESDPTYQSQYDTLTQEEREYWDEWLATPLDVIIERCLNYHE